MEFFLRTWSWWLITPSHWRSRSPWDCCAGVLSRVSTRFSQDYTHRIGRTGRAGKKGGQMWAEHQATWSAMSTNKWIWNLKWYEHGRKKGSTKEPIRPWNLSWQNMWKSSDCGILNIFWAKEGWIVLVVMVAGLLTLSFSVLHAPVDERILERQKDWKHWMAVWRIKKGAKDAKGFKTSSSWIW